jgi:hypothetical protein
MHVYVLALSMLAAVSCAAESTDPSPPAMVACDSDVDCQGGTVCARDGLCWDAGDVRAVHVTWTIAHQPADAMTCAPSPALKVSFESDPDPGAPTLAFAPVPCTEGLYTVDRIPLMYWIGGAETSATGNRSGMWVPLDDTDTAAIDLLY